MLALFAGTVFAQETLGFANGVRVVLAPDPAAPAVSIATVVGVGTIDEPEGQEGVAHLVEHLWFEAHADGQPAVGRRLASAGCQAQAHTWPEFTEYLTACPPTAIGELMAVEGLRFTAPTAGFTDDEKAVVERTIRNELLIRTDADGAVLRHLVDRTLYPAGHPVEARSRRPDAVPVTTDDARAFAAAHITPAASTIGIAGGFDRDAVVAELEAVFGPVTAIPPTPEREAPPIRRTLRLAPRAIAAPVEHPHVVLAWALPPGIATSFERTVLADLVGRVIYQRFAHDADVLGAGCEVVPSSLADPIVCDLHLTDDAPIGPIADQVRTVADSLWTPEGAHLIGALYEPSRSQYLVAIRLAEHTWAPASGASAAVLARGLFFRGESDAFGTGLVAARKAKVKHLVEVGIAHLDPQAAVVLAVTPSGDARPALALKAEGPSLPEPVPAALATATAAPVVAEARDLENGVPVLAVSRPDLTLFTAAVRLRWTVDRDPGADLLAVWSDSDPPQDLLTDVLPYTEDTALGPVYAVIGEDLDASLDRLLLLVKRQIRLDVATDLERMQVMLDRARTEPAFWAELALQDAFDPSGRARWEASDARVAAMRTVTPGQVLSAAASVVSAPMEVVVSGPAPASELLDGVGAVFGAAVERPRPPPVPVPGPPATSSRTVWLAHDGPMAWLGWRCPLDPAGPEVVDVVVALQQARLLTGLREQNGWTYGPMTVATDDPSPLLDVRLSVSSESVLPAAAMATALLDRPPTEAEVARAREQVLWAVGADRVPGPDLAFEGLVPTGLRDPAWFADYGARYRHVDVAAVAYALAPCAAGRVGAIAGPPEAAAGMAGPVEVLDLATAPARFAP